MGYDLSYEPPGPVGDAFLQDRSSFVKLLLGPVGSGKSVACVIDLLITALDQEPDEDGWRRTRFAVIRKTLPELKTTTAKTWLEWVPERAFGPFSWSPPFKHEIILTEQKVEMEVWFLSIPDDNKDTLDKLRSFELTAAWVNEGREHSKHVIDAVTERIDRYPSRRKGPGATYPHLVVDTNAPPEDHWWPIMSGDLPPPEWMPEEDVDSLVKPEGWTFYHQPGAVEEVKEDGAFVGWRVKDEYENKKFLSGTYYQKMIAGKSRAFVRVQCAAQYGEDAPGRPVHPDFVPEIHVASKPLEAHPGHTMYVGVDFGRTPAVIFAQKIAGQLRFIDELFAVNIGADQFCERYLKPFVFERFAHMIGSEWKWIGDPRGDDPTQVDDNTPFLAFRKHGFNIKPAPTNDPSIRIGAIDGALNRLARNGQPGFLVSPVCKLWIAGAKGKYCFRRLHTAIERYDDKPDKGRYSHPHDAGQYAALGAGEGVAYLTGGAPAKPRVVNTAYDPFRKSGRKAKASAIIIGSR